VIFYAQPLQPQSLQSAHVQSQSLQSQLLQLQQVAQSQLLQSQLLQVEEPHPSPLSCSSASLILKPSCTERLCVAGADHGVGVELMAGSTASGATWLLPVLNGGPEHHPVAGWKW